MKRILGLDLGSASIGWAVIEENDLISGNKILGMGSRIIPYEGTEGKDFAKGTGESRNAIRTKARTARKGYDRYQLRRKYLVNALIKANMMPEVQTKELTKMQLWELRSKAVDEKVSLGELGRLLLWLNQKRGYQSARSEANLNKADTEYVAKVKNNFQRIEDLGITIGQYFYRQLSENTDFRIKEKIFPREAYKKEYDSILNTQKQYYPGVLKEDFINQLRNEIIYYQRPLKSQKGLVGVCEFEGFWCKGKDNKEYYAGPKVAHKSSPLFQITKLWENINNIAINTSDGQRLFINPEQKLEIFEFLNCHEKLTVNELAKILKIDKAKSSFNKQLLKGIQGNVTRCLIESCLPASEAERLLKFNLNVIKSEGIGDLIDKKTGEILNSKPLKVIDSQIENEPLYRLWHIIYSVADRKECSDALQKVFSLSKETSDKLSGIDFTRLGFGNKSAKACRKILPYLMEGDDYYSAMSYAGYNHSNSLTKTENLTRIIQEKLKPLSKNSLRQPIVEKILNQMINLVNAVIDKYGRPDEIRVELARELKQSKEERNEADKNNSKRERENETIKKRLLEYGLRGTKNNILKWRLYEEIDNEDKKLNAMCIYCGQPISLFQALKGEEVDIEHIIPKAKIFDDSQSNKTLAHKYCNKDKNDRTAYDFMKSKPDSVFNAYVDRVNTLFANKVINTAKRNKLLMPEDKIPDNFIDRQLRESQYIARKAREILQQVCYHVHSTSGTVTAELRHLWGWGEVTMNLQIPKYREVGLTYQEESANGQGPKERITGWTKRDDHRHHAIDALTIACTKQGFIQRFNTLNSGKTREDMKREVELRSYQYREKLSLISKYIISQQPFTVAEVEKAVAQILISFKSGKKVAVYGTRKVGSKGHKKVVQSSIIVPRGALSEEQVYGRINTLDTNKPLKYLFSNPDLIFKPYIKDLIKQRIQEHDGDISEAFKSTKKNPIYLDKETDKKLEFATCLKEEYVYKYTVDINFNKTEDIVDAGIKQILRRRLSKFNNSPKEAFKDVKRADNSVIKWYEDEGLKRPIRSVRCYTGLSGLIPVRKDSNGKEISFLKSGNNHHIALYINKEGKIAPHCCTFWHAVERKKFGLPVIIHNSDEVWNKVLENQSEYPENFLKQLPMNDWTLIQSFQQNEMFVLGMQGSLSENMRPEIISQYLYRVQKMTMSNNGSIDLFFRHHLETQLIDSTESKLTNRYIRVASISAVMKLNPMKVNIDVLGYIKSFKGEKSTIKND